MIIQIKADYDILGLDEQLELVTDIRELLETKLKLKINTIDVIKK